MFSCSISVKWQLFGMALMMIVANGSTHAFARGGDLGGVRDNGDFNRLDRDDYLNNADVNDAVRNYDNRNVWADGDVVVGGPTCQTMDQCYTDGNCIPMEVCD